MTSIEEFVAIFRDSEEELNSMSPDFVDKINELLQRDSVIVGNKVGNRYSPEYSNNISRPSSILQCGTLPKDKKKKQLEEQTKLALSQLQEQDRSSVQQAAQLENELFEQEEESTEHLEVDLDALHVQDDKPVFKVFDVCEQCDMRHTHEERECEFCEQIHSGCCD